MDEKGTGLSPVPKKEVLSSSGNRILVLGSRSSGAYRFAGDFERYLEQKGIPNPEVESTRNAFYIEDAFLGRDTLNEGKRDPNVPKGVILFPEMRQYVGPNGMNIPTYDRSSVNMEGETIADRVRKLCRQYNVPLIEITEYLSEQEVEGAIKDLPRLLTK